MPFTNRTWAQVASKNPPKDSPAKLPTRLSKKADAPMKSVVYHQPRPDLAKLDILYPRCKLKNHTVVVDDLLHDEPRPEFPESSIYFPVTIGQPPVKRAPESNPEMSSIEPRTLTSPHTPASTGGSPNTLFFEKDEEEEASYAELLKGSTPDDTPRYMLGLQPLIGAGRLRCTHLRK